MRRIGIVGDFSRGFLPFCYKSCIFAVSFFLTNTATSWAADKINKIEVFPATPYDGYIIYESLAVFWLFIISLIVIIRMKLREIERIQELGVEEDDPDAPVLR
jgi:TRAP-type C4-dicarboxylate transport system permease small subunit